MLEKFNVKLNIIPDPDGVYETRMESGNLGDLVIWGNDGDEYMQAVEKGMLYDWNEDDLLTEYGPYIKEHMPYAIEKNTNLSGGVTYGFGFDVAVDPKARQDAMYTWDLRWDLYKELVRMRCIHGIFAGISTKSWDIPRSRRWMTWWKFWKT